MGRRFVVSLMLAAACAGCGSQLATPSAHTAKQASRSASERTEQWRVEPAHTTAKHWTYVNSGVSVASACRENLLLDLTKHCSNLKDFETLLRVLKLHMKEDRL